MNPGSEQTEAVRAALAAFADCLADLRATCWMDSHPTLVRYQGCLDAARAALSSPDLPEPLPVAWSYRSNGKRHLSYEMPREPAVELTPLFDTPARAAVQDAPDLRGGKLLRRMPNADMVEAGRKAMEPEKFVSHCRALRVWNAMWDAAPDIAQASEDYGCALARQPEGTGT